MRGVPQGTVLAPVLFTVSIKDTANGIECTLIKFVDTTKLNGVVDTSEGQDTIQRDLDNFKKWAHGNLKRFNKAKCKVQPQYQHRLGNKGFKSAQWRRTWGCWWKKSWA